MAFKESATVIGYLQKWQVNLYKAYWHNKWVLLVQFSIFSSITCLCRHGTSQIFTWHSGNMTQYIPWEKLLPSVCPRHSSGNNFPVGYMGHISLVPIKYPIHNQCAFWAYEHSIIGKIWSVIGKIWSIMCISLNMNLRQYFKLRAGFPDPKGSLSSSICPRAISLTGRKFLELWYSYIQTS